MVEIIAVEYTILVLYSYVVRSTTCIPFNRADSRKPGIIIVSTIPLTRIRQDTLDQARAPRDFDPGVRAFATESRFVWGIFTALQTSSVRSMPRLPQRAEARTGYTHASVPRRYRFLAAWTRMLAWRGNTPHPWCRLGFCSAGSAPRPSWLSTQSGRPYYIYLKSMIEIHFVTATCIRVFTLGQMHRIKFPNLWAGN